MAFKVAIVGAGGVAEVAYEYFCSDSEFEVVCFSVERPFLKADTHFGLPVVPFDALHVKYARRDVEAFVAISYSQLNRLRRRLKDECVEKGYQLASYVSSKASVSRTAKIGAHAFVLENNVIQP